MAIGRAATEHAASLLVMRCRMSTFAFILQILSGAFAGYVTGNLSKDGMLGQVGNAIVGALAGGIGGQILFAIAGLGGSVQFVSALLTGAFCGGLGMLVAGLLKSKLSA